MKKFRVIFFILIIFIILGVTCKVVLSIRVNNFSTPTKGKTIENYNKPNKALLVIDIQEDYTGIKATPPFPYKESDKFISTVNKIINNAYKKGIIPVYIRQEFDNPLDKIIWSGRAVKDSEGSKLDSRLDIKDNYMIIKKISDAFSNQNLSDILIKNSISELYVAGLDAKGCVLKTSIGAINRGYKVNIIQDGIITQNMNGLPQIIETYKQNGINVISSSELEK